MTTREKAPARTGAEASRSHSEAIRTQRNHTISAAIAADGYGSHAIVDDGIIHRFTHPDDKPGSNNCWYVSHRTAGAYGSWKLGTSHTWCNGKTADNKQLLKQIRAYQRHRVADMEILRNDAAVEARNLWLSASTEINHPYPVNKRITPYGARQAGNMLLVRMCLNGKIANVQRIFANGKKRFMKNARVTGCYLPLGDLTDHIHVCEGYATGCSLHDQLPTVCVAFNAGNMKAVALTIRKKYPAAKITIACDNDVETEKKTGINPGMEKGRAAAAAVGGDYIYPDFSDEDFDGTDYNDYLTQGGKL